MEIWGVWAKNCNRGESSRQTRIQNWHWLVCTSPQLAFLRSVEQGRQHGISSDRSWTASMSNFKNRVFKGPVQVVVSSPTTLVQLNPGPRYPLIPSCGKVGVGRCGNKNHTEDAKHIRSDGVCRVYRVNLVCQTSFHCMDECQRRPSSEGNAESRLFDATKTKSCPPDQGSLVDLFWSSFLLPQAHIV